MSEKEGVKEKRILHSVPGSDGNVHVMEYNIMTGWSCSCDGFKYRRTCSHVVDMYAMINTYGECTKCKNIKFITTRLIKKDIKTVYGCDLWGINIRSPNSFNCAAWEEAR